MIRLAVPTRAESFPRLRDGLEPHRIQVVHFDVEERTIDLTGNPPWDPAWADVGYVFPPRLMEGAVGTALVDIPWVNDREAVLRSRNKAGVIARLKRAGVPVPDSVLVSNPIGEDEREEAFHSFDGDVIVKPNSTTRGVGVAKASDLDSFLGITDYLDLVHDFRATGDKSFLVQEFVPDARDVRVMLIDGQYVGAVERSHPSGEHDSERWKSNVHRGAVATGVSVSDEVTAIAERVARIVDIPLLGVDFLLTESGPLVTETNARPTIDTPDKYDADFFDRLAALVRNTADAQLADRNQST